MKKTIHTLKFAAMLLLLASFSCEKKEITALPPETQTGANTFGCYINGELFVADRDYTPFGRQHVGASYGQHFIENKKALVFFGYGESGVLSIEIIEPEKEVYMKAYLIHYRTEHLIYDGEDIGTVYITKLDTVNKIVSGKFNGEFDIDDTNIKITDGRFDIKLDVSD
ncbi:MAG: hypothetical protein LBK94_08060 [Prevotellaceae bacterium]|jgi:hypothetical protein|nr:hypothetical protein [Prevotellaceae bacterium]